MALSAALLVNTCDNFLPSRPNDDLKDVVIPQRPAGQYNDLLYKAVVTSNHPGVTPTGTSAAARAYTA